MRAERIPRNEKSFGDSSRDRIAISQRYPSVARSSTCGAQEGENVFGVKVVAFVKMSSSLLTNHRVFAGQNDQRQQFQSLPALSQLSHAQCQPAVVWPKNMKVVVQHLLSISLRVVGYYHNFFLVQA